MVGVQRGLLIMMAAGSIALGPSILKVGGSDDGSPVNENGGNPAQVSYQVTDKEFYLAADQVSYVRPGLKVTLNSVTNVAPGQKPIVDLNITDDFGNPLDRTGATTPGVVSLRFIVATWDATAFTYRNLIIQASTGNPYRDTTGTWTTLDIGHYTYTFATTLPTFDTSMPSTLFCGGSRNVVDYIGKTYYVQTFKDFVPATGAAATTWGATFTANCNQCHDPLALHGGNYREAKACALCHNPVNMVGQIPGSGDQPPVDRAQFNNRVFFHQIHSGTAPAIGEITYPQLIQRCVTCHDPKAANGNTWATMPGMVACGSCHSDINWATGAGHGPDNLPQTNDSECATCHPATQTAEWDNSVPGSHLLPSDSTQLKGLVFNIVEVTDFTKGKNPTVKFKLTTSAGTPIKPSATGASATLVIGGDTKDYSLFPPISQNAVNAAYDSATGICTYTFTVPTGQTSAIPADATGTWTLSAASRQTVQLVKAGGETIAYTEGAVNPVKYYSVDGSPVQDRRVVVDLAKCNVCHYRLATTFSHGGQRITIQFCVMCHNPNSNDSARRPASDNPPESIEMARMIHRIHTGEEMTQQYTIYGFASTPPYPANNFNDVTYPGDRRNCVRCHTNIGTAGLPTAPGTLNTVTLRDYYTPQGPGTTACTGCHDNRDTLAHAYLNTTTFPGSTTPAEACGTCHNANGEWSTTRVHAR
jgi:OmcA/MtrC family decaheme c-type cytochrome